MVRNTVIKLVSTYENRPKLLVKRNATNEVRDGPGTSKLKEVGDKPSTSKQKKVTSCKNIRQLMYREFEHASRYMEASPITLSKESKDSSNKGFNRKGFNRKGFNNKGLSSKGIISKGLSSKGFSNNLS
ncbi:hypothetical protein CDL15_Pgr013147 [Punica granatum]|uniref:Uncharacterized protein n=1 Tax=Punica granatum TaxID=22663 RepID=A0A218WE50_PUNGR|nr:hypothetical protein CDL15_Pgr013147 [Punica granatum]